MSWIKVKNFFYTLLMNTWIYNFLLEKVIPYIRWSTYYTDYKGWQFRPAYEILRPGDVIVTIDKRKATSKFIGGEFSHACWCRSKNSSSEWEVSEMTHHNFTESDFFDICKESDRVVVLRCPAYDQKYIEEMRKRDFDFHEGRIKYDRKFDWFSKALSCSEHVLKLDVENRMQADLSDVLGIGRPYISPTGIYKAKNLKVVWDSDNALKPKYIYYT